MGFCCFKQDELQTWPIFGVLICIQLIEAKHLVANKTDLYKANLNICDTHRKYFGRMRFSFHLVHGEGEQEALLRLLASCFYASDDLCLSVGATKSKEPNLYVDGVNGNKKLWICLGTPSLGQLTRACRESDRVAVLGVDNSQWQNWWASNQYKFAQLANLSMTSVDEDVMDSLVPCLSNRVRWHGVLDHETLWLHHDGGVTEVMPRHVKTVRQGRQQAA